MKTGLAYKRRGTARQRARAAWRESKDEQARPVGEESARPLGTCSRGRGRQAVARPRVVRAVLQEDELGCVSCMIASCVQHASESGHRTTAGYRKGPRRLAAWRLGHVACGCWLLAGVG